MHPKDVPEIVLCLIVFHANTGAAHLPLQQKRPPLRPLSLRGYVLAATFAGNDVFVQRSRRLLRRRLAFPGRNSSAVRWLAGELAGYGLDAPVVDALLSHPH